jgi:hypothetical protein
MCFCGAKRITDHINDDALPSGTTHPTVDCLRWIAMIVCRDIPKQIYEWPWNCHQSQGHVTNYPLVLKHSQLAPPGLLFSPEPIDTPSGILFWMCYLNLIQQPLQGVVVTMEPCA